MSVITKRPPFIRAVVNVRWYAPYPIHGIGGPGVDKSGGGAGSVREAGGAFGKLEAAREEEYFYKKHKEQLTKLKSHLDNEIDFHQDQIKRHEEAIKRHKASLGNLEGNLNEHHK